MGSEINSLYPYQELALKAILKALQEENKALLVMACGLGKTIVSAFFAKRQLRKGKKGLFLCHDSGILEQTIREYKIIIPLSRSLKPFYGDEKDWDADQADMVFSTFQMLNTGNPFLKEEFDFIIVDESHHAKAKTYEEVINYFKTKKLLGITATPNRGDGQEIREIFGSEVFDLSLEEAITKNWLTKIEYHILTDNIHQKKLREIFQSVLQNGKKISIKQLNETLFIKDRDKEIIETIAKFNREYSQKTVIFCENIHHAENLKEIIPNSETYHSKNNHQKNRENLFRFKSEDLNTIITVNKFNEGIDVPSAEIIVFLRATDSKNIFIQQLGRGLRKMIGKEKVVVLDFVANCQRVVTIKKMINKIHQSGLNSEFEKQILKVSGEGFNFFFTTEILNILKILQEMRKKIYISEIPKLAKEYIYDSKLAKKWTTWDALTPKEKKITAKPATNRSPANQVIAGTNEDILWKCSECGCEWWVAGNHRTNKTRQSGCPGCANRVVTPKNNLAFKYPKLAREYYVYIKKLAKKWNSLTKEEKKRTNKEPPEKVIAGGREEYLWRCPICSHTWWARIDNMITSQKTRTKGCPACAHRVVTKENNLAKTNKALAEKYLYNKKRVKEWLIWDALTDKQKLITDRPATNRLPANKVIAGGREEYLWRCPICGYKWWESGNTRLHGCECPNWRNHIK